MKVDYGNSLNRPCFWEASSSSFNRSQAQHIIRTGSQQTHCLDKLQIEHPGVSSLPLTWHGQCVLMVVSWTATSITAHVSDTTCTFLLLPTSGEKGPFQQSQSYFIFTSIFSIFPLCYSSCAPTWPRSGSWLWSRFCVHLPAGWVSLLFLAHFKFPGTITFLSSVRTVPSTVRYQTIRKELDITIWQIRGI